jgi:hypothetical protein
MIMNRRNFLTTLFGAALAPIAVAKVLSSPPKSNDERVIYVPYMPLYYTRVVARKLELKDKWTVETS